MGETDRHGRGRSQNAGEILSRRSRAVRSPVVGGLFLLIGVAVLAGWDKWLESRILDYAPDWYVFFTTSV